MQLEDIRKFLEKFQISEDNITKFLKNKRIYKKENNVFLIEENFEKRQVYKDVLIYISLDKVCPTNFLLSFISEHTNNFVMMKSQKQAMNFTYGKNLVFDSVKCSKKLEENYLYLVYLDEKILGYVSYHNNEKFPLKNEFNIGEFLKEN